MSELSDPTSVPTWPRDIHPSGLLLLDELWRAFIAHPSFRFGQLLDAAKPGTGSFQRTRSTDELLSAEVGRLRRSFQENPTSPTREELNDRAIIMGQIARVMSERPSSNLADIVSQAVPVGHSESLYSITDKQFIQSLLRWRNSQAVSSNPSGADARDETETSA